MVGNDYVKRWVVNFIARVNAEKQALGIKHKRVEPAAKSKYKLRYQDGSVKRISVIMTKGDIMTHKGKGRYPENRKEKPWFNPIAEVEVPVLADAIAVEFGDRVTNMLIK